MATNESDKKSGVRDFSSEVEVIDKLVSDVGTAIREIRKLSAEERLSKNILKEHEQKSIARLSEEGLEEFIGRIKTALKPDYSLYPEEETIFRELQVIDSVITKTQEVRRISPDGRLSRGSLSNNAQTFIKRLSASEVNEFIDSVKTALQPDYSLYPEEETIFRELQVIQEILIRIPQVHGLSADGRLSRGSLPASAQTLIERLSASEVNEFIDSVKGQIEVLRSQTPADYQYVYTLHPEEEALFYKLQKEGERKKKEAENSEERMPTGEKSQPVAPAPPAAPEISREQEIQAFIVSVVAVLESAQKEGHRVNLSHFADEFSELTADEQDRVRGLLRDRGVTNDELAGLVLKAEETEEKENSPHPLTPEERPVITNFVSEITRRIQGISSELEIDLSPLHREFSSFNPHVQEEILRRLRVMREKDRTQTFHESEILSLITGEPLPTPEQPEQEYEPKQPFLGYDYNRFWTDRKSGRKSVKVGKQINNEEKGFSTNIPLPYNLKWEDNEERYRFFDNLTDARKQAYTAFNLPLEEGAEYALVQIRVFKRRKGSRSDAPLDPEAWVFVGSSDGKKEYERFELPEAASVSQRNEDGEWEDQVVNVRDIVLKNPDGFLQDQVFKDWRTQEVRARHDALIFKKLKELYPEWDFENAPKPAEIPPAPARVEPKVNLSPEQIKQQAMENDVFFSIAVGRATEVAETVRNRYQGDPQDFQATLVGMLVLFFRKLHESFRDQGILNTALDTRLSGIWAGDVATSFSEPAPQVEPEDPFEGVSADVDWGADIPAAPLQEEPKVEISPAPLLAVWNTVNDRVEKPAQTSQIEERKYLGRLFRLAVREHVQELERLSGAKLTSEEFDKGQFVEDAVRFYHTLRHNATLTQDFDDNDIKEMLTDILDETLS